MHACMSHSWVDPVIDIAANPLALWALLCIYGIVSDMLADASTLVEFGSYCNAKCLAIVHYEPALL